MGVLGTGLLNSVKFYYELKSSWSAGSSNNCGSSNGNSS